jgi:DNA-binding NarL/FixJ family response regulator
MRKRITVLVIEDNRLVRDALAGLLGTQPDVGVAAAEGASSGLRQAQQTKPHVVLLGATLGHSSSHRLVEKIRKAAPQSRVIVMDLLPAHEDVIEFVRAGASGFIVKDATLDDFVKTIRSVADGKTVVPSSLAGTLLTHIAEQVVDRRVAGAADAVRMTKREREIIIHIAEGLSNKEIAHRLRIAADTVKSHVHNILEKLALHSRLQIAAHHHRSGTTPDPK